MAREVREGVKRVETTSGVEIKPVYAPEDVAGVDYDRDIADPGRYPYTRGPYPLGYRHKLWTMRTYTGFGTARQVNEWNRRLLKDEGVTGLSTALDLPTQMGYDSDHPEWRAEVGRVGVALDRGLDIDEFAPRISWNIGAFMNFFEEVAKYRASRRIWARLMRERFGARDARSWRFLWFAGTCGSTFSHKQPLNNIVRATVETMALVLSGVQSLTVNTWQEAFEIPDQDAMMTALRTQQVIAYESGVADTVDPLAGCYFVESLTAEYERRILALMAEVKERGGMARGIEWGWVQQQVLEEAYRHSMAVESGERLIVGENIFQSADEPPPIRLYQHDPAVLEEQVRRLQEVRARRDGAAVGRALDALRSAARRPDQNLMPATVECVRAYCTIGEIMGVLRDEFGTFQEPLDIFG